MRCLLLQITVCVFVAVAICSAQDSHFSPKEQQIPVPECLTMKGLWEGGSKACTQNEHESWLADITVRGTICRP